MFITHAPGDFNRLFVVEQPGRIRIIKDGTLLATPFLNIQSLVMAQGLENGLLTLAFHPDYQRNGVFYVYYTTSSGQASPTLARFRVSADPDIADPALQATVLHIPYNIAAHRAGWMDFGPDGYLYISTGDGGEQDPQNNASNLAVLKGKILRIDVNGPDGQPATADDDGFPADINRNYHIPVDNPFVSATGAAPEIWAYGLRNPWRCSMDRLTHDIWIGDVGQGAKEEIDFLPAGQGGAFFGWRCTEGTLPTGYTGCTAPLPASIPPAYEYNHSAAIGGYVYRGCAIPWLNGKYVFGDWNAKVFSFRYAPPPGAGVTEFVNHTAELTLGSSIISSLGEDALGELYIAQWSSGIILKIVPAAFIGPDCNRNNINDTCDIAAGSSADNNRNGVPDKCDPASSCTGDVNGNRIVDGVDLGILLAAWSLPPGNPGCAGALPCPADVNRDGHVDGLDLGIVLAGWGLCR